MMTPKLSAIWVYLAASPLLWLCFTLLAYQAALAIYRRSHHNAALNPVAVSVALVVAVLLVSGTPYEVYFDGAKFVHFLLGPATVALAVPLYAQWPRLKRMFGPVAIALLAGSMTAVVSALALGYAFGASKVTLISLAPKSVTTPIAMGIAEKIGGLPSLAAVLVLLTGIVGGVSCGLVMRVLRIKDQAAAGFAMGLAAHGIGTARAFQVSPTMGAFSALAMGLNALATATLAPILIQVLL